MTLFKRTALAAAMMPLFAPVSWGLGLGDITMKSYLNEPLRAEVELLDVQSLTADDIRIRLATQEDFDRVGVDRAYFLTNVRFEVVIEDGQGKILLTTDQPLLEPYLDFLVETRWPSGRLLREYTVLVDLPTRAETVRVASSAKGPAERGAGRASEAIEQASEESAEPERTLSQPATRPDRDYDRDAGDQPAAGSRYLVKANDTLWDIAKAARPDGASVEQTMIATVDMNGDAFVGGNINGLKAGYVLELPSEDEIMTSRSEALDAVAQQNSDWAQGIRRAPALRVVADNEMAEPEVDTTAYDTELPVAASGDDTTNIESAAMATESTDDTLAESDAAPAMETGVTPAPMEDARSAELAAIQTRLGQLSEQVGSLRQLVTVKDQQIAVLQAELAARDARDEQAVAPMVAAPAVSSTAVSSGDLGGIPWWVFALGGVVVIAVGGVVYARFADKRFQSSLAAPSATQRAPVARENAEPLAKAPAAAPTEAPSEDGERGYGRKLHNDYAEENALSDAIAEADIYVAYGRFQQALNLLESVADTGGENASAYLKMVDIYIKCDRREEAEALLPKIEQTHDMDALKRAMDLLSAPAKSGEGVDLGELADEAPAVSEPQAVSAPEPDEEAPAALDFELVSHREEAPKAAEETLSLELELPVDDAQHDVVESLDGPELGTADWGDMADALEPAEQRLPPELAAVLGTDVPPPPVAQSIREEDDALIYATEADPMDTKLDLARAYIDMGDDDGARPVLEEVIANGDLQQQAEARELLIRID